MGKIIIKGLRVYAWHGVNPEEKEDGQIFELDIEAQADLRVACTSDRLDDTVSYAKITKLACELMTAEKNDLIERAAQRVAEGILNDFPVLEGVKLTLKKPYAPVSADFEYMAVEIELKRSPVKE